MALFIGSFNPPTIAHLKIALKLKNDLNNIIFIPVNSRSKKLIDFKYRVDMLSIYKRKYNFIELDEIMKDYSYFDYRILDVLKNKYQDNKIIIGSDLLDNLKYFDNYEYLLENFMFYVITRGENIDTTIKNDYYKYQNSFKIIEFKMNVSSSMARYMIKNNNDLRDILDVDVISYIRNNHLYF